MCERERGRENVGEAIVHLFVLPQILIEKNAYPVPDFYALSLPVIQHAIGTTLFFRPKTSSSGVGQKGVTSQKLIDLGPSARERVLNLRKQIGRCGL